MWRKPDLLSVGETNQKGLHETDMRTLKAQPAHSNILQILDSVKH